LKESDGGTLNFLLIFAVDGRVQVGERKKMNEEQRSKNKWKTF